MTVPVEDLIADARWRADRTNYNAKELRALAAALEATAAERDRLADLNSRMAVAEAAAVDENEELRDRLAELEPVERVLAAMATGHALTIHWQRDGAAASAYIYPVPGKDYIEAFGATPLAAIRSLADALGGEGAGR